jgi:hypothetical protein
MTERVRADAAAFDVDASEWLGWVWADVETFGKRIGLYGRADDDSSPGGGGAAAAVSGDGSSSTERGGDRSVGGEAVGGRDDDVVARCFGCLLTLFCGPRTVTA